MSAVEKLIAAQEKNKSYICLGLDLDPKKMPPDSALSIKGMYEFAMNIVEATKDHVCAYKPNLAFYEHLGHDGMSLLETIVSRMPKDIPIILDCKRGDIGNTASFYAEAMFEKMNADWVTLSPYMGYDSMRPFLEYKDKGIFVLCLTSNSGSKDFQLLDVGGKPLYEIVAEKVDYWNKENNCGLVVGATNPEQLRDLRVIAKDMPMLIPGVGAQGGSLEKSLLYGTDNFTKPAVINVSRSVLYASNGADYAEKAQAELIRLNRDSQKIKAGEYTETTPSVQQEITKEEPVKQQPDHQESTKTQVQGFTPPPVQEQPKQEQQVTQPMKPEPIVPPKFQPLPQPPEQETVKQPVQEQETQPMKPEPIVPPKIQPPPIPTPVEETVQQSEIETQSTKQESDEPAKPVEISKPVEQFKSVEADKAVEQSEPKKTPPPLPTPPPILAPNPEVMRRNREEQERRLKALQEQKQKQQNGELNSNNETPKNNDSTQQENSSQHKDSSSQNGNHQQNNHKNDFQSRRHNRNNR